MAAFLFYRSHKTDPFKKNGPGLLRSRLQAALPLATLRQQAQVSAGGPRNDMATPGLSFPYSHDLPVGEIMCVVTSNTLPVH